MRLVSFTHAGNELYCIKRASELSKEWAKPLFIAQAFRFPVTLLGVFYLRVSGARFRGLKIVCISTLIAFHPLQQRIGVERILNVFAQFDPIQLQQTYGLLQLRQL